MREALTSILCQSFQDFEVLLVDDGSDPVIEVKESAEHPLVQVLRLPKTAGVSAARNAAIRRAKGKWVAFLDSDDLWKKNKLELFWARIQQGGESCAQWYHSNESWERHGKSVSQKRKHEKPEGDIFSRCLALCCVSPSSVVIKSDILKQNLFDERFPVCEDYELWLRLSLQLPIELLTDQLTHKRAGHCDQLSNRYIMMDLWRILALVKLLDRSEFQADLSTERHQMAVAELKHKLKIMIQGAKKYQREELLDGLVSLLKVAENYQNGGEKLQFEGLFGLFLPKVQEYGVRRRGDGVYFDGPQVGFDSEGVSLGRHP